MSTIKAFGGKSVTRAPKGGFEHPVNGKSYKGGQFCPLYVIAGGAPVATPARALPALVGSEKQVAWAEKLRAEVFAFLDCQAESLIKYYCEDHSATPAEAAADLAKLEAELVGQSAARYWIDSRFLWTSNGVHFEERLNQIRAGK